MSTADIVRINRVAVVVSEEGPVFWVCTICGAHGPQYGWRSEKIAELAQWQQKAIEAAQRHAKKYHPNRINEEQA